MAEEVVFEDFKAKDIKSKKYLELRDIVIAWLGISICFALVFGGYNVLNGFRNKFIFDFANIFHYILVSLIVTGTAFILHELAHKYSAIYIGAKAQFIVWKNSLLFSIALAAIVGFVFVAPGAVYIFGKRLSIKEDGLTSLAGPAMNIIMAFLFMIIFIIIGSPQTGLLTTIITYSIFANFWIALFNLIPIGPLDGKKIFTWNPAVWVIATAIPVLFLFVF